MGNEWAATRFPVTMLFVERNRSAVLCENVEAEFAYVVHTSGTCLVFLVGFFILPILISLNSITAKLIFYK